MRPIDLVILVLYLAGVTVFGCSFYFRKAAKGAEGFVTGKGRVPSWAVGLSIFATLVSSISFLALPAKAFATNWNALVFSFTVPLTAIVAAAMSTVSAMLNSGATVIMEDWFRRCLGRGASERACVATLRIATVFLGLATVAWVVFFQKSFHANLSIVFGTCVLFASGLVFSFLGRGVCNGK